MLIRGARFFRRVITYSRQRPPTVFPVDPENPRPTVHIDVTRIAENDIRTGVQRVVRQICRHWYQAPERRVGLNFIRVNDSGEIVPAFAWAQGLLELTEDLVADGPVRFREADTLFLLDLVLPPRGINRRVMSSLRQEGVRIVSMVYDLLPITHPQYFPISSQLLFRWWAKKALDVDHIITISQTMKKDIEHHQERHSRGRGSPMPRVSVIPLSGEPEPDDAPEDEAVVEAAREVSGKLFICIGTIEPRKGYDEVIEAFEELWEEGQEYHLWIFGKPGWRTRHLQRKISRHVISNERFRWYKNAPDSTVRSVLKSADGLILNSVAEGFGLPIVEAISLGVPVIARRIRVFEEFQSPMIDFHGPDFSPTQLGMAISKLARLRQTDSGETMTRGRTWQKISVTLESSVDESNKDDLFARD